MALGAPAVAGDDLAAAWSVLVTAWAAGSPRTGRNGARGASVRRPRRGRAEPEVHARLASALAAGGVAVDGAAGTTAAGGPTEGGTRR